MIDRLRRMLEELGYPLAGAELLDVLLLARTLERSRSASSARSGPPMRAGEKGGLRADDPSESVADDDEPDELRTASGARPSGVGQQQAPRPGRHGQLFPDSRTTHASTGSFAHSVRVPGPRALPGVLHLARSLRPLRERSDHPHRTAVDVEATVRRTAESGAFDLVLRPTRELQNTAVLLIDDSPSMRVWQSLVPEVGRLLERSGVFRSVSVRRFIPQDLHRRHRSGGAGSAATLLLTDGVDPAWTMRATADAVAGLGAHGPVTVLSPLPQRLWRATGLQPQPHFLSGAQRFPSARQLQIQDPLTGAALELAPGELPVPIVALLPSSLGPWAQLITRPATRQLMQIAVLGNVAPDGAEPTSLSGASSPDELIAAFRGSFSPQAYSLAVRLSTIRQFTPLLMQLVRIATLPDATATQEAEVLLGGLLRSTDEESGPPELPQTLLGHGLYTFRPGVRELLSAGLSRAQTQEVTESVGRALELHRGRMPDLAALMPAANGAVRLSDGATPFAVLADPLPTGGQTVGPTHPPNSPVRSRISTDVPDGAALIRASAEAVAEGASSGQLALLLIERFFYLHGYRPAPAEVRIWERALPELAAVLCEAGLSQVHMLVDYALPLSSKRVDVVLAGLDPVRSAPSYVMVELKLWVSAAPDADDPALCHVGAYPHPVLNPLDQVIGYCNYLTQFHTEVSRFPECVEGVAYLPNATELGAGGLRHPEINGRARLLTGENRSDFVAYLRTRFNGGHLGTQAADALLLRQPLVSRGLMSTAAQEIRERSQFVLLDEQQVAFRVVLEAVRGAERSGRKEVVVVTGGPGSGKSVVALSLLGELYRRGITALHATGSVSLTKTLRAVAGARKPEVRQLFKYFNSFMEAEPNGLDVLICDEAHGIRRTSESRWTRPALRTGKPQIDELIDAARVPVFFLDEHQVVRPNETGTVAGIVAAAERKGLPVRRVSLDGQFRSGGSRSFLRWLDLFLGLAPGESRPWEPDGRMQLLVADSPMELEAFLEERRSEGYSARMAAGFCWDWSPEPRPGNYLPPDIVIGDWARPWHVRGDRSIAGAPPAALWATDPAGFGQVGSVYTAQGFEYDWSGVIMGPDLVWRDGRFVTDRTSSKDPAITARSVPDADGDSLIRMAYKVLLTRGMVGTVVYSTDAPTREKLFASGAMPLVKSVHRPEELLHPAQREAAYRPSYNGPALVTGGPGTGKTLVALHRVRHLLGRSPDTRVLLTSDSNSSVAALRGKLSSLLERDMALMERVDVVTIDEYVHDVVARADGRSPSVLTDPDEQALWSRVATELDSPFTAQLLSKEYQHVVLAQRLLSRPAYLRASRRGRGVALSAARRALVWSAVELFERLLRDQQRETRLGLCLRATYLLTAVERPAYRHVVADDAQDIHPAQWRVLRAAVEPASDDLFIVGDPHQRINDSHASFRSLGIAVAGRGSRLDRNHRSTAEILSWSTRLLRAGIVDDLSGDGNDTLVGYHSQLRGLRPDVSEYGSEREEIEALVERIQMWLRQGVLPSDIGVCARAGRTLDAAGAVLREAGVPVARSDGSFQAQADGVFLATMHRMKGMEFRCVAVLGATAMAIPFGDQVTRPQVDELQHEKDLLLERQLLFVACTRARESLAVSWSGEASPFVLASTADD
ncbi:SAV_2336 N-terminal domain-related protein [Streptomyces clavifer]|uniref:SAV_2336 N-terminal domain-related protein n=1 Tax=Streptomyces clavifer TaxID=68188 RepID=UPI00379D1713